MPDSVNQPYRESREPTASAGADNPVEQAPQEHRGAVTFLHTLKKRLRRQRGAEQTDVRDIYPMF